MSEEITRFCVKQVGVRSPVVGVNWLSSRARILSQISLVVTLCLGFTSISRHVHEKRMQIGDNTIKKHHFPNNAIRIVAIVYIILLVLEFASIGVLATQQELIQSDPVSASITWTRNWGGKYRDYAYDAAFNDGALFVTGDSYSYETGPVNLFIQRYNRDGLLAWSITYSPLIPIQTSGRFPDHARRDWMEVSNTINLDDVYTMGRGVAVGGNSLYVSGIYTRENTSCSLLLKFDKDGHIIWERQWQPEHDAKSTGVALDGYGNVFVTGYVEVSASIHHGYLLKYNEWGDLLRSRIFDSEYTETSWGISVSDAVYLCGEAGFNSSDIDIQGITRHNMFLKKIDLEGNIIWSEKFSSGYNNVANSVDAGCEISVAGYTKFDNGTTKIVLLRYGSDGELRFSKIFGESNAEDVAWGIVVAGEFTYVVGHTCPYFHHPADACVCKLGPEGNVLWWDYNWGEIRDRALSVAVSGDEVYVVGETFQSGMDSQVFVTKYDSPNFVLSPFVISSLKLAPLVIGCLLVLVSIFVVIDVVRRRLQRT
jgi:hypothetical protein